MSSSSARIDIDDADPRIHYSAGWSTGKDGNAYDRTLHYAQFAGLTATLRFNGTMVGIMGCGGDTASIGYPSTSIVIDGKNANLFRITTNTPTSPAALSYNFTLFSSPTLARGAHTIVLTNLNETSPNLFVLDRFWYIASDASNATSTSDVVQQPSTTVSATPHASTVTRPLSIGAIVGGAVGGAVALLLAVLGTYCFMKRKMSRHPRPISFIESEPACSPASMKHISPFVLAAAAPPSRSTATVPSFGKVFAPSLQAPKAVASSASPDIGSAPREPPFVPRTSPSDSEFTQRAMYSPRSPSKDSPPPGHMSEHGLLSPSHSSLDEGSLPPYTE